MRFALIVFFILLLDQASKLWALKVLSEPLWIIPQRVGLNLTFNEGVAFSVPIPGVVALLLGLLIVAAMFWWYRTRTVPGFWSDLCFAFLIGGALGNLADRLVRGSVVDFIQVFSWPTFNLADSVLTIGFLLLLFCFDRIRSTRVFPFLRR